MAVAAISRPLVFYPETDGQPMAESDKHRKLMHAVISALESFFSGALDVYVTGNLLLYYVEGDARKSVAPDVFVAFGVPKRDRRVYKLWEEGKGPDVVIEITSDSTQDDDLGRKFRLYEQTLRVPEYFLYDPTEDYLHPPLQGYRLRQGKYAPCETVEGRLHSETLNLDLAVRDGQLRLFDPQRSQWLLTPEEYAVENKRLRAELEALRNREAQRRTS